MPSRHSSEFLPTKNYAVNAKNLHTPSLQNIFLFKLELWYNNLNNTQLVYQYFGIPEFSFSGDKHPTLKKCYVTKEKSDVK